LKIVKLSEAPKLRPWPGEPPTPVWKELAGPEVTGARNMTFGVGIWKAGDVEKEFRHEPEEVMYVLRGSGVVKMDGEEARISEDMCIFVPSNALHQVINDSTEELVILWVHSPAIPEQLDLGQL
jgi:mannose-6-phosphate isomerase-like protein (cupin superfamily)